MPKPMIRFKLLRDMQGKNNDTTDIWYLAGKTYGGIMQAEITGVFPETDGYCFVTNVNTGFEGTFDADDVVVIASPDIILGSGVLHLPDKPDE